MSVAEQLGCEDEVFLSPIVHAYETDGQTIGPETTLAVRGLKTALETIRETGDDYERGLLAGIDSNFFDLDHTAYTSDQPNGLQVGRLLTRHLARGNREQIVGFAIWYQGRVQRLGEQLAKDQPLLAQDTLARTERLINDGLFPKTALNLMNKATGWASDITPIGSVEQVANNHSGYCGRDGIGLANLYTLPIFPAHIGPGFKQTAFHEHLHAIGHISGERRGLFWGLTERAHPHFNRWLEEAYVSQVAYEVIIPATRANMLKSLANPGPVEEQFLKVVLDASPVPLDLADLSAAHFSGRQPNTKARLHVARGLGAAVNTLFPRYENEAWQRINQNYAVPERRIDRGKYLASLLLSIGIKPVRILI